MHEGLLRQVEQSWQDGEVAVVYVRLDNSASRLAAVLAEWQNRVSGLIWRHSLGMISFYLIGCGREDSAARLVAMQYAKELQQRLDEAICGLSAQDAAGQSLYNIGSAPLLRPNDGTGTEEALFAQLVQLMEQSYRERQASKHPVRQGSGFVKAGSYGLRFAVGQLAVSVPVFEAQAKVSQLAELFEAEPKTYGAVIVKNERPVGIVTKQRLHKLLAGQFGFSLYANRPLEVIMDGQPLILEDSDPVELAAQLAMSREYDQLYDMVVTVKEGKVSGAVTVQALLECMTALRTEEARTASPLTGLPGNAGIQAELSHRLEKGETFAVVYADLDYFKWFNDCFGFARGDELIRYLGELMVKCFSRDEHFFVGHVGGDDFIGVAHPETAELACRELLAQFDEGARRLYSGAENLAVEDRQGRPVGLEGVTLSLSLLICSGGEGLAPEDISLSAARLKKKAKAITGSSCVTGHLTSRQPSGK
ncbi:GGDEF domain-containing protein [Paenibacillus sp. CAU 1782]